MVQTVSVREAFDRLSNAGRWGSGDAAGTLNLIDDAVRLGAVATVRRGRTVALGQEIQPGEPGSGARLTITTPSDEAAITARDELLLAPHGWATTHIDALGHCFFDGTAYNRRDATTLVDGDGLAAADVAALAGGIVTRGVLLDVPAALGLEALPPGTVIGRAELEAAERSAGTLVRAGDALLVRSGLGDDGTPSGAGSMRTGMGVDSLLWMHERSVAVFGGDCVDALPSPDPAYPDYFHQLALAAMGLVLLDLPDLRPLRVALGEEARHEFLLVVAPLRIRGATGSAVNPIAVL